MGWCVTTTIIPPLADMFGRKWIVRVSCVIQLVACVFIIWSKSIDLTITFMFISGMATSGRVVVGFVYGSEFLTQKWRILFGVLLMFTDGATVLLSAIYFDWISK